ncbi:MAG: hypothetical protein IIW19_03485, partial [Clostridia bacterium]|nr:hypothetical protein [Clostridia bacterium]
ENKITAGKDAVLKNSDATFAWKALANGGIGYDMTQSELTNGKANNTYLDLGNAVVDPYQNFSVEYVTKLKRTSDGVNDNHNTGHSTEKFGIWGSWSFRAASWRLLYHDYGKENHWGHGVGWYGDANFTSASSIVTVANRMSAYLSGGKVDCSRYIFANGVQKSATTNVVASGKGKYNEVCYDFYLMLNVANETYAVRVYDRELSNDEILRNSVVDRWAYNGITVNSLIGKPDAIVMHAVNACKNLPFEANEDQKAAMQDAVDAAVALYVNMINVQKDEYDSLYVKDGMSMLFSAYDNTDSSLDLANGLWYNKAEAGVATIVGGLYNASSNKMGWQKGEKGIYWTQRASVSQGSQKNGIYFDINDLPEGEYTVEQIVAYDGITNDDGSKWDSTWKYKADNSGVSGARYGYNVEAFAFGAVRSLSFISNKHYKQLVDDDGNNVGTASTSGDGAQNRWYYTGLTYNEHGSNPSGYGAAIAGVDADKSWQNYKAGEIVNFTATYDYIGGDTYDTASSAKFTVRYNGAVGGEFTANAGCANKVEEYATTLLPNNAGFNKRGWEVYNNQKFHTMVGIAGSIYAIRVYDRTLTEAEMKQNHAVDLMAYFNMDVTGFAAASEEAKARVYEAFAGKTFAASALEVSVMQTAIDRAVEDSIVGVVVSQKSNDSTALRIVGALETMENVSRVGFVITFKQNGEVVKTFGEATVENTATVTKTVFSSVTASGISYSADALCAEYLYAAVVKGVPAGTYTVEVTPFYVDVEDNVFTGEMKSQTVTF